MKSIKFLSILAIISLSFELFGMESNDNSKQQPKKEIKRPVRTVDDVKKLGAFGQLPDDIILKIALDLIDQNADTPEKTYGNLRNLAKTNRYLNNLLEVARVEKDTKNKLELIKTKIAKKYVNILEEYKGIVEEKDGLTGLKNFAQSKNIQFLKDLIRQHSTQKDILEEIEKKIYEYKNIAGLTADINWLIKKSTKVFEKLSPKEFDEFFKPLNENKSEEGPNK